MFYGLKYRLILTLFCMVYALACKKQSESEVDAAYLESYDKKWDDYFLQYAGKTFIYESQYGGTGTPQEISGLAFTVIAKDSGFGAHRGERGCPVSIGEKYYLETRKSAAGAYNALDLPGGNGKRQNFCDLIYQYVATYDLGENTNKTFNVPGDSLVVEFKTDSAGLVQQMLAKGKTLFGFVNLEDADLKGRKGEISDFSFNE